MERQLIRMRRKKRARRRIMIVLGITFLMALVLVAMRACTGGFDQAYKKTPHSTSPANMMNPRNIDKLKQLQKFMENK